MTRSDRSRRAAQGRIAVAAGAAVLLSLISTRAIAERSVRQDHADKHADETRAEAPDRPADMPLAELPVPPTFELAAPRPLALEAIDRILAELISPDPVLRERGARSLLEAKPDWVSGIARRVDRLAERTARKNLALLLENSRKALRGRRANAPGSDEHTTDVLELLLSASEPESPTWSDLVQVLSLNRMLAAISTAEAAREVVRIHLRFGEFMRIDCQQQLAQMGDRSLSALIESQRHQAPAISEWATKLLRTSGRDTPHKEVQTEDQAALAEILVALGRLGDPEATEILISFAATERTQLRIAARQGIVLLGEPASWQLRDAYLSTTGKRAPRDWTWKRTARELFTEFDRLRVERLYKRQNEAQKAGETGDLAALRDGYDQVLALSPDFGQGPTMASGYQRYAEQALASDPEGARLALRRALRIDKDPDSRKRREAALLLLEAERQLRAIGAIDETLLGRAVLLDPSAQRRAKELGTPATDLASWGVASRYFVAATIAGISLLGAAWVGFSALRRRAEIAPSPPEPRAAINQEPTSPANASIDREAQQLPALASEAVPGQLGGEHDS